MVAAWLLSIVVGIIAPGEARKLWSVSIEDRTVIPSGDPTHGWVMSDLGFDSRAKIDRLDLATGRLTPFRKFDDFADGETVRFSPTRSLTRVGSRLQLNMYGEGTNPPPIVVNGQSCHLIWDTPRRRLAFDPLRGSLSELKPGTTSVLASVTAPVGSGDGGAALIGDPDSGAFAISAWAIGMTRERVSTAVFGKGLKPLPVPVKFVSAVTAKTVLGAPERFLTDPTVLSGYSKPGALTLWDLATGKTRWRRPDLHTGWWWNDDIVVLEPKPILISGKTGKNLRALPEFQGAREFQFHHRKVWVYRYGPAGEAQTLDVWSIPGLRESKTKWPL